MAGEWTDELKAQVIKMYEAAKPTEETSVEIIADIAEEVEKTVNGVRMILIKAGVYVKKGQKATDSNGTKSTRVNKTDSINALSELIESQEIEVDEEILGKLTGKAAVYFTKVLNEVINAE